MNELLKLAQALLGPTIPVALIAAGAIGIGRFLDTHLKPQVRTAYLAYLHNGGLRDSSTAVIDAAADAMNLIFGPRHLSWRCFLTSAAVTISSIVLLVALSGIFSLWISSYLDQPTREFLSIYWFFDPISRLKATLTWIIWAVLVDYVSLYKTRVVIKLLRRHAGWGPIVCVGDFFLGFAVYIAGVSALSLMPILIHSSLLWPPAVSFEMGVILIFILVLWGRVFVPDIESKAIAHGVSADQIASVLHGDLPQTVLGMAFVVQLIPFATIGSDLFYASMMPSIWLWFFVAAVFVAKVISAIGAYLEFALTRFRKPKRTLQVTGTLLIPVLITLIYLATLSPYALVGLGFLAQAVLGAFGLLAGHLTVPAAP